MASGIEAARVFLVEATSLRYALEDREREHKRTPDANAAQ
jgi:hypothetical protein